jgi:hypothetical protein
MMVSKQWNIYQGRVSLRSLASFFESGNIDPDFSPGLPCTTFKCGRIFIGKKISFGSK